MWWIPTLAKLRKVEKISVFLDTLNLPDQVGPPPKKAKKDEIEN